jgi:hypothetical protein
MTQFKIKQIGKNTLELHSTVEFNETILNTLIKSTGVNTAAILSRYVIHITIGELFELNNVVADLTTIIKSFIPFENEDIWLK